MGRKPVSEPVRIRVKELMLEHGKTYSSAKARGYFKMQNVLSQKKLDPPWPIYSEKSYQRVMTEYRKDGIFTKGSTYDSHAPFKYSESIGDGPLQILPEDSHYALEVCNFYLTNFRHTCSIGFVQEYVKVSRYDPDWDNVQAKSLKAEVFWVHRIKKTIEGRDPGSVEYEELQLNMKMHRVSTNVGTDYQTFVSIVEERGLQPWSQTVRDSKDYLPHMPQFNHVAQGNPPINADRTPNPYVKPEVIMPIDEEGNVGDPISFDDLEPPLPDTPDDATSQLTKDAPSPYGNLGSLGPPDK